MVVVEEALLTTMIIVHGQVVLMEVIQLEVKELVVEVIAMVHLSLVDLLVEVELVEIVQKVLKENGIDVRLAAEILNQIREVVAEEAVEREKPAKKQHLVLVSEPEGGLPKDLVGWVVQILEDDDPREASQKITEVAGVFNGTPKGQRLPVASFGDACQSLPTKLLKENNVWIKTREPVRVIAVKNSLGRRRG